MRASVVALAMLATVVGARVASPEPMRLRGESPEMHVWRTRMVERLAEGRRKYHPIASVADTLPDKCGTPYVGGASPMAWPGDGTRPPWTLNYALPDGHCRVWYAESSDTVNRPLVGDADHDGVPDYVERATDACERAWLTEVDTLGWAPPLNDSIFGARSAQNPDSRVDVFLWNLGPSYYGVTRQELSMTGPGPCQTRAAWIECNNDFADFPSYRGREFDALRVTIAHEFNHVLQFVHNGNLDHIWLNEATSVWFEDRVYSDVNDYVQYLPGYFHQAYYGPDGPNNSSWWYGMVAFTMFLTEWGTSQHHDGPRLLRRVWEQYGNGLHCDDAVEAISAALSADSLTFREAINQWAIWTLHTGRYANPSRYFREGASWPEVTAIPWLQTPGALTNGRVPFERGMPVFVDLADPPAVVSAIDSTPPPNAITGIRGRAIAGSRHAWDFLTVQQRAAHSPAESIDRHPMEGADSLDFSLSRPYQYERNWAVVVGSWLDAPEVLDTFTLTADTTQSSPRATTSFSPPGPNPYHASQGPMVFPLRLADPGVVAVTIFTVDGGLVRSFDTGGSIPANDYDGGAPGLLWDGKNGAGRRVASGVYFVVMRAGGASARYEIAVLSD